MAEVDNRQISRDSLFIMADLRVDGTDADHRVKVRNLSAGGLMAEGAVRVLRGQPVRIALRNAGWVEGTVAWVQESRFGVAFHDEIDPKTVRGMAPPALSDALILNRPRADAAPAPGLARKLL